jgi:putative ABC transport system permease protein
MTGIGPARLTLRGLREVPGVSALIALLVLVAALLTIGAPRLTLGALTSALHQDLAGAAGQIALQTDLADDAVHGPDNDQEDVATVWSHLAARLSTIRHGLTELDGILQPGQFVGTAKGLKGTGFLGTGTPTTVEVPTQYTLEAAPSLHQEARLVAGRWPHAVAGGGPIEVVIAAKAAKTLGWQLGQTQTLADSSEAGDRSVTLVGTVAPRDARTPFWRLDLDREGLGAIINRMDDTVATYFSIIWADDGSWPTVAPTLIGHSISAWYGIDVSGVTADRATEIAAEVRRFEAEPASLGLKDTDQQLTFSSGLTTKLADFTARSGPSTALIALFDLGPVGALAAVLLLGLRLLRSRRSSAEALLRARGASGWQLRLLSAAEIAVWTIPAAVIGAVVAVLLTPGQGAVGIVLATAILCSLVPPIAAAALAGPPPGSSSGDGGSPLARAAGPIAEATIVLVAALALVVLVARGPVTAASGVDPLVEVAPLLLAVAVTVVVLRLTPFAARRLGTIQRRGAGAVGLIVASSTGLARRGGAWALFALIIGVGMSVFSLTMVASQQHGVVQASLNRTGSDIAVSGTSLDAKTVRRIESLPGVAAHAIVQTVGRVSLANSDVAVYSVDPAALAAVQRGIDGSPLRVVHGTEAVVTDIDDPPASADLGALGKRTVHLAQIDPDATSIVFTEPRWMLVDSAELSRTSFPSTVGVLVRLRPGVDPAATAAAARRIVGSDGTVNTAAAAEAVIVGTPLDRAVHTTIYAATILAALLCLLVFVMTLTAGAAERLRRGVILRALGFDRRQGAALVVADVVPSAIIGVVAGTLTGVGLAAAVLHTIEPDGFVGAPIDLTLSVDVPTTVLVLAGFLVAAVLAAAVAVALDLARPVTAGLQTLGEER